MYMQMFTHCSFEFINMHVIPVSYPQPTPPPPPTHSTFVWHSPLLKCVTRLRIPELTLYIILLASFLRPVGFPNVLILLNIQLTPDFVIYNVLDGFRSDDGRLFPSLYFILYNYLVSYFSGHRLPLRYRKTISQD